MKKKEIRLLDVDKEREKLKEMVDLDPLVPDALKIAITKDKMIISATLIRRNFQISYPRAARMMDQMEYLGYVSEPYAVGKSKVLISLDDYNKIFENNGQWKKIVEVAFCGFFYGQFSLFSFCLENSLAGERKSKFL